MATKKKSLYEWLSIRVNVNIRNEENFALKRSIRFSYAQALVWGSLFFVLFSVFALWIATKVVGFWYNPREDYFNTKRKVISLAMSVDSLEEQIRQKDLFISHIKSIVETGEVKEMEQGLVQENGGSDTVTEPVNLDVLPEIDSVFRSQFETSNSLSNGASGNKMVLDIPILMAPAEGSVTEKFNIRSKRYGVKITTNKAEPLKAVYDGNVIFSYWTIEDGHVLGVQHPNNLVSVYKQEASFAKKVGNWLKTGDIISLPNEKESNVLVFELWMNGDALNPSDYILF